MASSVSTFMCNVFSVRLEVILLKDLCNSGALMTAMYTNTSLLRSGYSLRNRNQ